MKSRFITGALVLLLGVYLIDRKMQRPPAAPQWTIDARTASTPESGASPSLFSGAKKLPSVREMQPPAEKARVTELMPKMEDLRAEVSKNPHQPPDSLVRFAIELSTRMASAQKSEGEAVDFFAELETCALNREPSSAKSTQALCLINANRLGTLYPALNSRALALRQRAAPEVLHLTNQ